MLLVAIWAKNVSPLHWLMTLGMTGRVANRHAVLLVAKRAKNISPLHLLVVLGLTGRVVNRVCGVAGCDSGEKYFAPTLIGGVGAYGSGCEQDMRCCWLRFGRIIFRPDIG